MLMNTRAIQKAMTEIEKKMMARQEEVIKENRKTMSDAIDRLEKLMYDGITDEVTKQIQKKV